MNRDGPHRVIHLDTIEEQDGKDHKDTGNGTTSWNINTYCEYIKQNLVKIEAYYSTEYVACHFVVDTENGSTLIQNLIDPEAVKPIGKALDLDTLDQCGRLLKIYQYILSEYEFAPDPDTWPTVKETIRLKKGDCNSLSLLMMSLLCYAGIDVQAAISNGHMWVKVFHKNKWRVFELDQDPERRKVYRIPGFYRNPLYQIFIDRSEKRKKIAAPNGSLRLARG